MCHNIREQEEELFPVNNGTFTLFRKSVIKTKDNTDIYQADMFYFQAFPPCILAVNHLFQLHAHNMLNTYIYHHLPPTYFGVCYTIFKQAIALLAQELYAFCSVTYAVP
jgi:hypothetical protein